MSSQARFSRKIALRYLWSRRSEAFITIISIISIVGVALGVAVINMVMAIMTGFEHELREKIVGANAHVTVKPLGGKIYRWRDSMRVIDSVEGVVSVSPYTYNQGLLRTEGGSTGILVRGITPESAAAHQLESYLGGDKVAQALQPQSRPAEFVQERAGEGAVLPPLIVGRELARTLSLYPGSTVSLLSPNVSSTPFGLMPRFRRFAVTANYKSGLVEYESGLAYTSLEEAQRFFQLGDAIAGFEVRVDNLDRSPTIASAIHTALGGVGSGFYVQDWTETNRPLWEALKLEKRAYFLVLLLIIIMASFSIVATLIMIVLEKRRDIAVLRTIGATGRAVRNIFLLQGSIIGALGVVVGLFGGIVGCLLLREYGFPLNEKVFQMSTLPVRIEPVNFVLVGAVAFVICFAATIYPAWRASRLEPSELLRHE